MSSPSPSSVLSAVRGAVRKDAAAGILLLAATLAALAWANTPAADVYESLRDTTIGPAALHLDLTLGQWAADGLLAIFFFVVGLELKQEIVAGSLRSIRTAAVPVLAAIGGVIVPAATYLLINTVWAGGEPHGWAVPAATDIAFAVTILALVGSRLPSPLRVFLLTLAVVDDLMAILIIAVGYSSGVAPLFLLAALITTAVFGAAIRRPRFVRFWVLVPLAAVTWALVHEAGVHATIAGVLLAATVPTRAPSSTQPTPTTNELAHRLQPLSGLVAVPVFAFFAAGVTVRGLSGLAQSFAEPVTIGIIAALVIGKPLGILGVTYLATRLPGITLDPRLRWPDLTGIAVLAGIGFTVSLLIGELAFGTGSSNDDHVKVGVLTGSLIAATSAAVVLAFRNRQQPGKPQGGIARSPGYQDNTA